MNSFSGFNFLGTGSAFNTQKGNTSCYIIENKSMLLIDCGSTVFSKIIEKNLLSDIDNLYVIITHNHPDHIGSLGDLIFYMHYKKQKNINIISPSTSIIDYLRIQGIKERIHYNIYYCSQLLNKQIIINEDFNIDIRALLVPHCNNIYSYSYILYLKNDKDELISKVFYSGDTSEINKLLISELDTYNYVYHEVSSINDINSVHVYIEDLNNVIPIDFKKKFYLMHFDENIILENIIKMGFNIAK